MFSIPNAILDGWVLFLLSVRLSGNGKEIALRGIGIIYASCIDVYARGNFVSARTNDRQSVVDALSPDLLVMNKL